MSGRSLVSYTDGICSQILFPPVSVLSSVRVGCSSRQFRAQESLHAYNA